MTRPLAVTLTLAVVAWAVSPAGAGLGELRPRPAPPPETPAAKKLGPVPGTVVYRSSFDKGAADGWSGKKALPLDRGKGMLYPLHNQTARLDLPRLPAHKFLHVRVDLHLLESWDGSGIAHGGDTDSPDTITLRLGGRTLLHASFAVVGNCVQSYPDNGLWARHAACTGAVKYVKGPERGSSLYRLALTIPHADRSAALQITARLTEAQPENRTVKNECWGIGRVVVSALPDAPVKLDAKRFGRLWADLADTDPVKANEAAWTLIAAGQDTVARIEKSLAAPDDQALAKAVAELIARLDADDWRVRQKATAELKALGKPARPLLHKALAGRPSPEVRTRVEDILSTHKGVSADERRAGRARWVLQVIGGERADELRKALPVPKPEAPKRSPRPWGTDVDILKTTNAVRRL
jgi:hypothetical protein